LRLGDCLGRLGEIPLFRHFDHRGIYVLISRASSRRPSVDNKQGADKFVSDAAELVLPRIRKFDFGTANSRIKYHF
jgi:hypothetical protein